MSSEATSQATFGGARIASSSEANTLYAIGKAKASVGEASKALLSSAKVASSSEANLHCEAKPALLMTRTKASKDKPKASQSKGVIL